MDSNPSSGVYTDQRLIAGQKNNWLGHPLAHRWAFHINSPKQHTAKRVSNKMSHHSADLSQPNLAVVGSFQWRATDYLASSKTDSPIDLKLLHLTQDGDSDRCKFPSLHFPAKLLRHCSASILVWKTSMSTRASHWRLCWKSPLLISYPKSEWPWICCFSGRHLCRPKHPTDICDGKALYRWVNDHESAACLKDIYVDPNIPLTSVLEKPIIEQLSHECVEQALYSSVIPWVCWKGSLLISYPMSEWPWICCLSGRHLCRPEHPIGVCVGKALYWSVIPWVCWKGSLLISYPMSEWPWIWSLSGRHLVN